LSVDIKKHIRHEVLGHVDTDEAWILSMLPERLRKQLLVEVRQPFLLSSVVFHAWCHVHERSFKQLCCDFLKSYVPHADEEMFGIGESCQYMIFVQSGDLAYLMYSMTLATISDGRGGPARFRENRTLRTDGNQKAVLLEEHRRSGGHADTTAAIRIGPGISICEPVLWCAWQHRGDLTALNFASCLQLDPEALVNIVSRYPGMGSFGADHADDFIEMLNTSCRSDLFDSSCCLDEAYGRITV